MLDAGTRGEKDSELLCKNAERFHGEAFDHNLLSRRGPPIHAEALAAGSDPALEKPCLLVPDLGVRGPGVDVRAAQDEDVRLAGGVGEVGRGLVVEVVAARRTLMNLRRLS